MYRKPACEFTLRARACNDPNKLPTQVTFNYCYVRYDEEARDCLCEHPNCVKTLGTKRGEGEENGGLVSGGLGGKGRGGGDSGGGGGGDGGGGGGGRGRRKGAQRLEDPQTGETVRTWLHTEDAEVRASWLEGLVLVLVRFGSTAWGDSAGGCGSGGGGDGGVGGYSDDGRVRFLVLWPS